MKGGVIRPMSGAMVAVAAGWGRSGRRIGLIVKTKPPCGRGQFCPRPRERATGKGTGLLFCHGLWRTEQDLNPRTFSVS